MEYSVSFGAQYLRSDNIKQFRFLTGAYTPRKVSIVKIDATNERDVAVIQNITKTWEDALFVRSIRGVVNSIFHKLLEPEEYSIFAVTTQKKIMGN